MPIKHSKFKNTGILFELLTRQITSDILSDKDQSPAIRITEQFFSKNKELGKELILYRSFFNTKGSLSESSAREFVQMVSEQRGKIDNKKLAQEKYNLISAIKENYNLEQFLKRRVPSYRVYASVYKHLQASQHGISIDDFEDLSEAKNTLVEHLQGDIKRKDMLREQEMVSTLRNQQESLRLLSYKILQEKFNEKYKDLSDRQKNLLREFIHNVSDRKKMLDMLKMEAKAVSLSIRTNMRYVTDEVMQIKLNEVVNQLKELDTLNKVENNHLTALMIGYEIDKHLQENFQNQ